MIPRIILKYRVQELRNKMEHGLKRNEERKKEDNEQEEIKQLRFWIIKKIDNMKSKIVKKYKHWVKTERKISRKNINKE